MRKAVYRSAGSMLTPPAWSNVYVIILPHGLLFSSWDLLVLLTNRVAFQLGSRFLFQRTTRPSWSQKTFGKRNQDLPSGTGLWVEANGIRCARDSNAWTFAGVPWWNQLIIPPCVMSDWPARISDFQLCIENDPCRGTAMVANTVQKHLRSPFTDIISGLADSS